jgi:15-cis-phytoene desaturase
MERADVIVVGAGLSGLACAFELASAGRRVVVLEARPHLGGRTAPWVEDGMPVESGFHRFRGIYRALPALLARAGIALDGVVSWQTTVELRVPGGGRGVFGVAPWHDPVRTLRGVLGNHALLTPLDKASLLPLLALGVADHTCRPHTLDQRSVLAYAPARVVRRRALERVVWPLTRGVFFRPPEDYSAYAFMMPLAFSLRRPLAMRAGVFRGGMTAVLADPLAAAVVRQGGLVRAGAAVRRLRLEQRTVTGVELDHDTILAPDVVVATPLRAAQALLQPLAEDPRLAPFFALPATPAVTLQIDLDRPALEDDHPVFGAGTALICFAEESRTAFRGQGGRLSVVLSPPERFINMPPPAVLDEVVRDAATLGLDLTGRIQRYRVVAMPGDFYAAAPGHDRLRPEQATAVPGLTLAGDYTRQPVLTTMEGAVLAGQRAARVIEQARGPR